MLYSCSSWLSELMNFWVRLYQYLYKCRPRCREDKAVEVSAHKMFTVVVAYLRSSLYSLAAAGCVLLKQCWNRVKGGEEPNVRCHCKNRVRGSVVVVTGANVGIGYSAAQDLARKGARVYLGCRRHQEGEATAQRLRTTTGNTNIFYLHLDLTEFSSIRLFVSTLTKPVVVHPGEGPRETETVASPKKQKSSSEGRVDAVVNNAAVFHHPPGLTVNNLEVTYHTNFLGVYLLTTLLLSLIQRSPAPRIIFISSEAHKRVSVADLLTFTPREVRALDTFTDHVKNYGISKLALHLFAQHLIETAKGVEVVVAEPGNVWTGIYRYSWQAWTEVLTRFRCYTLMRGTLEGAQSTIHALNAPSHVHGKYINSFLVAEEERSYDGDLVREFIAATSVLSGLDTHQHHNM